MKRCLTILIIVTALAALLSVNAFSAAAVVGSGTCGNDLDWTLDSNGVLTISGTGSMTNWSTSFYTPWYRYRSSIKTVVISDSVTTIGSEAFENFSAITKVTIGKSVTSIGDSAFYQCSALTNVAIPDSVTSIGGYAFSNCNSLAKVTIGKSVTSIGERAFYQCSALTNVTIPDSVTSIGGYAFYLCGSLSTVTIGKSVTTIGEDAFSACKSLSAITVAKNNPIYSSDSFGVLFNKNKTTLIQAPRAIRTYTIPSSVTTIDNYAFARCESLTSVNIPNSVTTIGNYAFNLCSSLTRVSIPASVTSIGNQAFYVCESLSAITVAKDNPIYSSDSFGVLFNKDKTTLIKAPGAMKTYTIPNSVTTIQYYAFSENDVLTAVVIPDSVTTIENHAFDDCPALSSVNIPNSVITIGGWAFYNCDLTTVTIPESVTSIGDYAFCSNSSLTTVTISGPVTTIPYSVFVFCDALTTVTIPNSVTSIVECAFYGCDALQDVYFDGTEASWNAISIGKGNDPLLNAEIHFIVDCGSEGHTLVTDAAVAATCTKTGLTEGSHCGVCGEVLLAQEIIPATGHDHTATVTEPDCNTAGYTTYTCACGDSYVANVVVALGHSYGNPFFDWTSDLTSVSAAMVCSRCSHGVRSDSSVLTWTSTPGNLTVIAAVSLADKLYMDTKVISCTVADGKVMAVLPDAMSGITIYAAGYSAEHRMETCVSKTVTNNLIELPVSGEGIKLFFLNRETLVPVMPCLTVK